jgi:hypothetical protein
MALVNEFKLDCHNQVGLCPLRICCSRTVPRFRLGPHLPTQETDTTRLAESASSLCRSFHHWKPQIDTRAASHRSSRTFETGNLDRHETGDGGGTVHCSRLRPLSPTTIEEYKQKLRLDDGREIDMQMSDQTENHSYKYVQ